MKNLIDKNEVLKIVFPLLIELPADVYEDIKSKINALPTDSEWVSCEDRLPESNKLVSCVINVLCLFDNDMQYVLSFIKEPNEKGNFYLSIGTIFDNWTDRVIAWQPLPSKPTK